MAIILPHSVFFHIPKTGGTFVTEVIKKSGIEYEAYEPKFYDEYNLQSQHVDPDFIPSNLMNNKKSFAFVRNPYTWYQSMYAFRARNKWGDYKTFILDRMCRADSFKEFVKRVCEVFPAGFLTIKYKRFLGDNLDKINYIGKQETLRADLIDILSKVGDNIEKRIIMNTLQNNRASSLPSWCNKVQYDDETGKLIRKVESWAFERLGYD